MAEMSATGYKWLYDATRAKVSDKLRKAGAEPEKVQRFFNELDKKKKASSGKTGKLAEIVFEERVMELLEKKKLTSISDMKKNAPKYAKKIKVAIKYKNNVIQLLIDGKQAVGVA